MIDHCEHCGFVCEHTFDGPTCTKCGYMSGGIDNPLVITYDGMVYHVPYSATFYDFYYLYSNLGYNDYEESLRNGYWVVVTEYGEETLDEFTALCSFGHYMTIEYRTTDVGGGEGGDVCLHPYFDNGVCGSCGAVCEHHWHDGFCLMCNMRCEHGKWNGNVCDICGSECEHSFFEGTCMNCGYLCNHAFYEGYCRYCGMYKGDVGNEEEYKTVTILLQDAPGSDSWSEQLIFYSGEMTVMDVFDRYFETDDGKGFYLPYESRFMVRLDGTALSDEEMYNTYVYDGCPLRVYRCFVFDIEVVENGESRYVSFKHTYRLGGYELLYRMDLASTSTSDTAMVNGVYYVFDDFINTLFPMEGEESCYIRYESIGYSSGTVRLEVFNEGMYNFSAEEIGELNIQNYVSCSDFEDFLWTLILPDGSCITLDSLDTVIHFMPEYVSPEYGASVYRLEQKINVFFVDLNIDNVAYEQKKFYISDNITLRVILESFGVCDDLYNYNWMFSDYEVSIENLDSVVYRDLYITAFDNRPCIELNVDGVSYKAYHTETLTLADAIDLINSVHGTSITFEGYIWSAYSNDYYETRRVTDPYTFIVVEPGYSRTATAKTLNEVKVYFVTDFGPINDEIGMESITLRRDSAWVSPEIAPYILEMANGFVTFTGGFEYRVEEKWEILERYDVNSIEELFALNLEEVTLHAKYEVNYSKLCGTYVNDSTILVITESTITKFSKWDGYFGEAKEYQMSVSGGYPSLRALDWTFDYSTHILAHEYTKIEDGGFCAVVRLPDGWIEMYLSYDDYLNVIEWTNVDYVTDKDGGYLGEVSESGLYFVYTSEKPYVEE